MDRSVDRLSWPKTGSYDVHGLGVLYSLAKEFSSDAISIPDSYNVFQKIVPSTATPEKFTSRPLGTSLNLSKPLLLLAYQPSPTLYRAPRRTHRFADFIFPPPRVEATATGAAPSASALTIIRGDADDWWKQFPGANLSIIDLVDVARCVCLPNLPSTYVSYPSLSNATGCLVLPAEALLGMDPLARIALQLSR